MAVKKEKLKEKYFEYQVAVQQHQQLQENISSLEKHMVDTRMLLDNLDSISKSNVDQDSLMPLGNGIFVRGSLKDNKTVVMNVGSGVCVEKTIDEAKDSVLKQIEEVNNITEQMQEEIFKLTSRIQELQDEFQLLSNKELEDA